MVHSILVQIKYQCRENKSIITGRVKVKQALIFLLAKYGCEHWAPQDNEVKWSL